ncbi:amino acid ABC transporter permease [Halothermothrix orenii]|uniref:Polar amino acid ABC transporter, inner membrane subunit n=1 Tax=Halothermothrix orenii (strain H 168 / OCM 544 / DSM 9562) TaxID=373903 RepID=B8CZA4_HALOH|nr:amino acid ABC transporter permease [Halothermothrix orenii]ACL70623.1 polar amino acid ABC transporter, inner membrane subunit [Halothermothrix orenii H 168]
MVDFIQLVIQSLPDLIKGLQVTMLLTLVSIVFGFILGIILIIGKLYGFKFISWLCTSYIEIIRGTPLLVQLFILYYGLPPYGIKLTPLTAAIIGFSLNSAAYQAEYLRGSIKSVSEGQLRAAYSIGMGKWQGIFYVVLPQALIKVIPSWTNEFIYLLKYTSLAYIIGAPEMMAQAKLLASRNYEYFKTYLVAAGIYLIVVLFFTSIFNWLEKKYSIPGFGRD